MVKFLFIRLSGPVGINLALRHFSLVVYLNVFKKIWANVCMWKTSFLRRCGLLQRFQDCSGITVHKRFYFFPNTRKIFDMTTFLCVLLTRLVWDIVEYSYPKYWIRMPATAMLWIVSPLKCPSVPNPAFLEFLEFLVLCIWYPRHLHYYSWNTPAFSSV